MIKSLRVRDYMTEHPVTLPPDMPITQAIEILVKNKISGATVVNEDGKIVGVLSELDCLRALRDGAYYGENIGLVSDFMTREVDTARPDQDILELAEYMISHHRRRLPIASEDGRFLGQFSARALLKAILKYQGQNEKPGSGR